MMSFAHQTSEIKFGRSHTFKFAEGTVSQYLLGISEFHIEFNVGDTKDGSFEVQQMGISLSHNLTNQGVTVYVDGTLLNHECEFFDRGKSHATVVILAWTGSGDGDSTLTNANNISKPVPISVRENPSTGLALLAGFNFSFGDRSKALSLVDIEIGTQSLNSTEVTLQVTASIYGGKDKADCAGDGALFALYGDRDYVHPTSYSMDSGETKPFSPPVRDKKYENYVAFMTGFRVAYASSMSIPLFSIEAGITVDAAGQAKGQAGMTGSQMETVIDGSGQYSKRVRVVYKSSVNRVSGITLGYSPPPPQPPA